MKSNLITPKNSLLRKYIQYFFFVESDSADYETSLACYPNTNHCLGIHKGSQLEKESDFNFQILPHDNYHSYLSGIYQKPMSVNYAGIFKGLWINFEPMGLEMLSGEKVSENLFLQNVIETVFPKNWTEIYDLAFCSKEIDVCASRIESFLLKNLPSKNKFEHIPFNKIHTHQVDELKDVFYKSYSSINRLYKNTLNISPKEFLNILNDYF